MWMYSNWAVRDSKEHLGGQACVFKTHFSSDDVSSGGCDKISNAAVFLGGFLHEKMTFKLAILQFFVEKLDARG